jgi:ADP-heptose:LPS heptosyltransferase
MICEKYPDTHILFLDSPNPEKRTLYGDVADRLKSEKGYRISRVGEGLEYMNTIMSMADVAVTPDTGFGHLAGALGKPNVMFVLGDPVQWSTAKTVRVMHPKSSKVYGTGRGTYDLLWRQPSGYYIEENGERLGASDIDPSAVFKKVAPFLERH